MDHADELSISSSPSWLALAIGNSRWHWARFEHDLLVETWDEPHRMPPAPVAAPENYESLNSPIWIASVVPEQSQLWVNHPQVKFLTLADVPLQGMYSTLGIDRALALWGAITTFGSPILVIDAGTALTFTGADRQQLVGGAILPGLRLQFESLGQKTAMLPELAPAAPNSPAALFPPRWACNTEAAIASGILYTITAGIRDFMQDWWHQFPASRVVMTGGDCDRLYHHLRHQFPEFAEVICQDPHLIFRGMWAVKAAAQS